MSSQSFTAQTLTWWIAHGPDRHTGRLRAGESLSTGQETLETFTRFRPYLHRLIALGGTPEEAHPLLLGADRAVSEPPALPD